MENSKNLIALIVLVFSAQSFSFCGFFVARAKADLFNSASKVVLARHENKTVITMANNFEGDLKEFAMVIPVPTILEKGQINIANNSLIDHLDSYTAPRLVEYHDEDPCNLRIMESAMSNSFGGSRGKSPKSKKKLGVKVEAKYQIGEYDILILSAKESNGLVTWLTENEYQIPDGAEKVLKSYLRKGMKFFVAKVNLKEQAKLGYNFLRPIQVAYESNKFMLPIRLGMLNAKGPQDLFVYALTKKGRVEPTNYRMKKLPSNINIPTFIKNDFSKFYKDMFSNQVKEDGMKSVWLEYAWDMGWCDPCAADPLSNEDLRTLGAFWQDHSLTEDKPAGFVPTRGQNVYVTRMHLRYTKNTFPEDLKFQVTANKENFQGRYILNHKWTGSSTCKEAKRYREDLPDKIADEADNLTKLTGWELKSFESKLEVKPKRNVKGKTGNRWWDNLWNQ